MNESTRQRVVRTAERHGFVREPKADGTDRSKLLKFSHPRLSYPVYVHRIKGVESDGTPKHYVVAMHPATYRAHFHAPQQGLHQQRKGGSGEAALLFSHSGFEGFPRYPDFGQPCAYEVRADDDAALDRLLGLLLGNKPVTALPPASEPEPPRPIKQPPAPVAVRFDDEPTQPETPALSGLVIRPEPIEKILRGEKDWEMRSRATQKRGRIALIRQGSGQVVGVAELARCEGPFTEQAMRDNQHRHRIPLERLNDDEIRKWRTAWVLENVVRLSKPVTYPHPSGAVTWVTLSAGVTAQINKALTDLT